MILREVHVVLERLVGARWLKAREVVLVCFVRAVRIRVEEGIPLVDEGDGVTPSFSAL